MERTLLARLVHERNWTVTDFVRHFNDAGRCVPGEPLHAISERQAVRWLMGQVTSLPYPASRRVLEAMFGRRAADLLGPPDAAPPQESRSAAADPPPVLDRGEHLTPHPAGRTPELLLRDGHTRIRPLPGHVLAPAPRTSDHGIVRSQGQEEVAATDRREFGGVTLAAIVAAAGEASDDIATADPTPLTLEEMESAADDVAQRIYDVPHDEMLRHVGVLWFGAYTILRKPVSSGVRSRLLVVAGSLAGRAATLGRWLDDADVVRQFGTLAGQYAAESGDPLLVGQVANMRARTAIERGQYVKGAEIAGAACPVAHPAYRARLVACRAEALAASGREVDARAALAEMHELTPGAIRWTEGDRVIFSAVTLGHLRDDTPAADLARTYVAGDVDVDTEGVGWAHTVIGQSLITGRSPSPVDAAAHGVRALEATAGPNMSVVLRTARLHTDLRRRWPELDEVIQLGETIAQTRAALNEARDVAV